MEWLNRARRTDCAGVIPAQSPESGILNLESPPPGPPCSLHLPTAHTLRVTSLPETTATMATTATTATLFLRASHFLPPRSAKIDTTDVIDTTATLFSGWLVLSAIGSVDGDVIVRQVASPHLC